MDAFGKEYLSLMLAKSVSQFSIKFYMQSVIVCLKKMFNGETVFHLTEKIVLLQQKGLTQIIIKFRAEKKLHISIIHQSILLRDTKRRAPER